MDLTTWQTPRLARPSDVPIPVRPLDPYFNQTPTIDEGPLTPCLQCTLRLKDIELKGNQSQTLHSEHANERGDQPSQLENNLTNDDERQEACLKRLQVENAELRSALHEAENRLHQLQEGVVQLQEEYQIESAELKDQVERMSESIQIAIEEKQNMKRDVENAKESRKSLEVYLNSLPSASEFSSLKEKLRTREDEFYRWRLENQGNQLEISGLKQQCEELKNTVAVLRRENVEISTENAVAKEILSKQEKRRIAIKRVNFKDPEVLLNERDEFAEENQRLSEAIKVQDKKLIDIVQTKESEISRLQDHISKLKESLREVTENLKIENSTNSFLRDDLGKSKVEAISLKRENSTYQSKIAELKAAESFTKECERTFKKLGKEVEFTLSELKSISLFIGQLVEGDEVDVTELLFSSNDRLRRNEFIALQMGNGREEELIETLRRQSEYLKSVRQEVSVLRKSIAEKYSQSAGNNMTSCITQ